MSTNSKKKRGGGRKEVCIIFTCSHLRHEGFSAGIGGKRRGGLGKRRRDEKGVGEGGLGPEVRLEQYILLVAPDLGGIVSVGE